ncbi:MAG: CarD family transcriptional regulator [Acidobacteriota bacterium]
MQFSIGDKVVYPNQGVCEVKDICRRSIAGRQDEFYVLKILSNHSMLMIPIVNVDNVGLRRLAEESDLDELFEIFRNDSDEMEQDWKNRYKDNVEKMKTGCILEVGRVLQSLYFLSFQKALSFREKKMYERAWQLVVSEIATVRNRPDSEIHDLVDQILTSAYQRLHAEVPTA